MTAEQLRGLYKAGDEKMLLPGVVRVLVRSQLVPVLSVSLSVQAQGACGLQPLLNQRQDVATVQRLEDASSVAYLHGDIAYGISKSTGADGKPRTTRYADYYIWENEAWHAFFAQQTQF
jgi:hypothetical protein